MKSKEIRIRVRLMKAGIRPRQLARALNKSEQFVGQVISGKRRSRTVERALRNPRAAIRSRKRRIERFRHAA